MQYKRHVAEVGLKCFPASVCLLSEYHWSVAGTVFYMCIERGSDQLIDFNQLFTDVSCTLGL